MASSFVALFNATGVRCFGEDNGTTGYKSYVIAKNKQLGNKRLEGTS